MGFLKIDVGASTKVCIEIRSTPGIAISSDHDRYRLCIQSITRYGKLCLQFYQLIRYFATALAAERLRSRPAMTS